VSEPGAVATGSPAPHATYRRVDTDKQGVFDLAGVIPGRYLLFATTSPPGVRSRRVKGVVVNADTGQLLSGNPEFLLTGSTVMMFPPMSTRPASGFDLQGILPGKYTLNTTLGNLKGSATFEVTDRDVDVTIPVSAGFSLAGRVVVEGALDPTSLRINLRLDPNVGPGPAQPAVVGRDGSFALQGVIPGNYRLGVSPVLQNAFVKFMRLGEIDVLNPGFHLDGPSSTPVTIVINTNPGELEGQAVNDRNEPIPTAMVVLVPEMALRTMRRDLFKNIAADASGRFSFKTITPGNYKLFAWEDVETSAWLNAEFLREFEMRGMSVQIGEGGRIQLNVAVIPIP